MDFGARSNTQVITRVAKGLAEAGVVPIENSIGGVVMPSLDGLHEHNLLVVDRTDLDIHQTLAGVVRPEDPQSITRILSHPQGLAQCDRFLRTHYPNASYEETGSTVEGMEKVAEAEDPTALAIGPDSAVDLYDNLVRVERAIEDQPGNQTRFVAFSREAYSDEELDFVMLALVPEEDRPDLLHDITGCYKGINASMVHSRTMGELGTYMFYVTLDMKSGDERYETIVQDIGNLGVHVARMSA